MKNGTPMLWDALDFSTFRPDVGNAVEASYMGYPDAIRGVDPESYARDAVAFWNGAGTPPDAATPAAATAMPASVPGWGFGSDWLQQKGQALAIGGAGFLVGLAVVTLGVAVLIFGRD